MTNTEDYTVLYTVTADSIEVGDQLIIEGDLFIVQHIDSDREDIDEVFVKGDNLSGGETEFSLFADDEFDVWAVTLTV